MALPPPGILAASTLNEKRSAIRLIRSLNQIDILLFQCYLNDSLIYTSCCLTYQMNNADTNSDKENHSMKTPQLPESDPVPSHSLVSDRLQDSVDCTAEKASLKKASDCGLSHADSLLINNVLRECQKEPRFIAAINNIIKAKNK